ncbi:hypothetical protein [Streptomyces genisteinicus]|uniref:Amino acid ABC transporter substrate-binding protein n=1 Tax=Streptomyces genisteinicus TaxID=2768068 RepID=A0A7H0HN24_9ACTN|nr:hypothetical protein [Streptomyces genisteinicus]QNP61940.1 hypothetical protein IAG43_02710 [Streptomyces genisteinicus]
MTSFLRRLPGGPLTKAVALLGALVVLGGAAWIAFAVFGPDPSCGEGIEERGPEGREECTGVTDGGFVFADNLAAVSARIKAENDRIRDEPHVSVAVMLPMTATQPFEQEKTLHEVQGAYLAQYRANHDSNSKKPAIRLLLANPGRNHDHWRAVAEQLGDMSESDRDNLRAVIGFDVSTATTQAAIGYLTRERGIPVVDALKRAFAERTAGSPRAPEQFRAPDEFHEEGTTANAFDQMVDTICTSPARVVYFAGRPVQLRQFVNELGNRGCTEKKYTVITGSGASTLSSDDLLDWDAFRKGVTLQYAAVAHPDAWTAPDAPATGGSAAAYRTLAGLATGKEAGDIGEVELTDSRTITFYDAGLTAFTAIRMRDDSDPVVPTLDRIRDAWLRLHGMGKVEGASGWICLDNYGNPYNKAVSVVELSPDAPGRIRFVGLAWPTGRPTPADCTASRT